MKQHVRSNAIAYLALFVALGGTSYAAVSLPRNSVGATQIKAGAVRSSEVKDRSLSARDFRTGQLPRGATGPAGAAGPQGATGPKGDAGPRGDAGPTYGRQRDAGGLDPIAGAVAVRASQTLTLPTAGRILAFGKVRMTPQCVGDASTTVGLYVDDVPIPGTGVTLPDNGTENTQLVGLSGVVAAGERTVAVKSACVGLVDSTGTSTSTTAVGGVLIGG